MKKNRIVEKPPTGIFYKKALNIMKISTLLLFISFMSVQASVFSQQMKVNLRLNEVPLELLFNELSRQTQCGFLYNHQLIQSKGTVSVNTREKEMKQVLDELLPSFGLKFIFEDNTVIIQEDKNSPLPQLQNRTTIRGVVKDTHGQVMPGVTVVIKGSVIGVSTNQSGVFTIQVPKDDELILVFSFVGMQNQEVKPGKQQELTVIMYERVDEVDEVVITGFFPRRKEGFAGTVNTITREDLQKVSTSNIFTTLNTLDPSFRILENNLEGSNPNALPDFTIRGKGSFQQGSTKPLFILDGFEVSVETVFDLDMNRIESITLLKDASATILYGSRAANGVIVIETLIPKTGEIRVSYGFKPTIAIADLTVYDLMNAKEKLEYEVRAGFYDPTLNLSDTYTRDLEYYKRFKNVQQGVDTYWLSQPVTNSFSHQHSLRIDGGVQQLTYAVDAGYNKDKGVMKESGRDRMNLGITLGYRIRDKVTIQNRVNYSHTKAYDSPYGSFSTYAQINPYERIRDDKGNLIPILLNGDSNPLYDANLPNRSTTKSETLNEQLYVDWIITRELRLRGQLGINKTTTKGERYTSPYSAHYLTYQEWNEYTASYDGVPPEKRGELSINHSEGLGVSGNMTITYNKLFAEKHLFYTGIGAEFSTNRSNSDGYVLTGFSDDRFSDPAFAIQYKEGSKASSSESTKRSLGAFINLNYIYDNRYFADISARLDGNSSYGRDKRYGIFWAFGTGWNIHNENFWGPNSFIDIFKLRASYGATGNQEFEAYQAKTTYNFKTDRIYWNSMPAVIIGYGNSSLKWQTTYTANYGLDLQFVKRRLTASFNYYRKQTKNTLTDITGAPSLGLSLNQYKANLGEILNSGYDLSVNGVIIRDQENHIEWALSLQGTHNKNKIVKISNLLRNVNDQNNLEQYIPGVVYEEGESMDAIKAVKSLGIDPGTGHEIYLKKNGELTTTWDPADKITAGVAEPKFLGTIGTNLEYKNWNLNMVFSYSLGGDYYNQTLSSRVEGANPSYNADRRVLYDRWKEPGDYALYRNIRQYTSNYISTRFIQRENYIKMTSLSLAYEFDRNLIRKWGMNLLRISAYANDLFRISTIKEERGINYPFERSFVFEVKVAF